MPGKKKGVRKTADEYVIGGFSYLIVGVFALLCFVPILLVVIYSFTPYDLYLKNHFDFFPSRLTLDAYRMVTNYRYIWTGYGNTLYITFFGSILSLIVLVLTGYPLSKKDLKGRNVYMTLWIITMFFSGGMIPNYFLIRTLGLLNNPWSLILPGLVSCYNLILMKNYKKMKKN